jgi:hypothetical protein
MQFPAVANHRLAAIAIEEAQLVDGRRAALFSTHATFCHHPTIAKITGWLAAQQVGPAAYLAALL